MSREGNPLLPPRRPKPNRDRPRPPDAGLDPIESGPSSFRESPQGRPSPARRRTSDEPRPETGGPTWMERLLFGSVSTAHLATFCRQFAAYLDAGVDLLKALASLERQFARTALGPVISRLQLAIRRGDDLTAAMAREPQAFDTFFLSMMRVAEARGGVPETLHGLAQHYEARLRLYRQARSAMIYPVIVLLAAFGVMILLTVLVLPIFISMLRDMARGREDQLPLLSRLLIAFTQFMLMIGWWLLPVGVVVGVFMLRRAYKTASGKAAIDAALIRVPVFGLLLRKIDTARLARSLAALLEGGVDIGSSLDLTASVAHLAPFRHALLEARAAVIEGTELSEALGASGRFSSDVIAIVGSGEETGKLPESLERLADDYEEQVQYMVKNLGSLVQPLVIIILGGIVLFIILAVLLPYIQMITSWAGGRL
jgi:type IV pilus assembly protein PilC